MIGAAAVLAGAAVFHGTPVPTDQAPWIATLTRGHVACGGSLIAPDRVLTAAHCVQNADPRNLSVRIGGERRAWRGAILPPSYREIPAPAAPDDPSASATADDLAVILLDAPVTGIPPLPVADPPPVEGEATLTLGHGSTGTSVPSWSQPPLGASQVVSGACPRAYGPALFDPALHLCTLDPTPAAAQACGGDSGSPVMVRRNGGWAVAAVVTWGGETEGRGCGEGLPDVSERVAPHRALLTATTAIAPYAPRRVRVRRGNGTLRCVAGVWKPSSRTLSYRWWRRKGFKLIAVPGRSPTRRDAPGLLGCTVTARTAGGWASADSYNAY
jgi:hypothetical protein